MKKNLLALLIAGIFAVSTSAVAQEPSKSKDEHAHHDHSGHNMSQNTEQATDHEHAHHDHSEHDVRTHPRRPASADFCYCRTSTIPTTSLP